MRFFFLPSLFFFFLLSACNDSPSVAVEPTLLQIISLKTDGKEILNLDKFDSVSLRPSFEVTFSVPIKDEFVNVSYVDLSGQETFNYSLSNDKKTITLTAQQDLADQKRYLFWISKDIIGMNGEVFSDQFSQYIYTILDPKPKFDSISDEALLTLIQSQTFKYFWDFGHPVSGLARERNTSGETVTIGGSGFGIMSILVGIERNFITRQEGIDRLATIIQFLKTADRFHGVWPHWINGTTGKVVPFSPTDDGADLVETAFLVQGLLTVRQYLNSENTQEAALKTSITQLWESVEWDWFTQGGQNVLYWHWSPNFGWQMNHQIQGWNEGLVVYVLAAASPTHAISADVYHKGWARNGAMQNGKTFYGFKLPLGSDRGGPLFFAHYSFIGLDPRNLEDKYANYWEQNVNHSKINQAYCASNPKQYIDFSADCWGLTASDNHKGYSAQSPDNDLGVITPTAAISSLPYTPELSMAAIRHFYYLKGDKLWGNYGFYDAFNATEGWYASSYLAIDQGPIITMIENHRTAMLWELLRKDAEITNGLEKLGFTSF
jgi:hypothetical protein